MVKTKGLERTVSKYVSRTAVAGPDYEAGIKDPKRPWAESTKAAADNYHTAVSSPTTKNLFISGVGKAGNAKWADMALRKGVARYADGVEKGKEYFRSGMSNVISTIESTTLGPRGPTGSEANYGRAKKMGMALRAMKLAQKSS